MAHETPKEQMSFKDTLNLPHTDFPIRPNAKVDDPAMIERWEREKLFDKATELHQGNDKYILHDGPPYANGHLHLGHAYNKILKDIVTKTRRMLGYHVPVIPGWDCHGLPIEFKVSQENPQATPLELKKLCRAYAQHWIDVQRSEFKRLGVVMDWDHPYITMDPGYEAQTVRAFGELVAKKFIERKNKTVAWCASCQTVLASAEIEYKDRKDPSLYVLFALDQTATQHLFPRAVGKPVNLVIWTTTPWTLPLNRAVMLHPTNEYALVDFGGMLVIVGAQLVDTLAAKLNVEKKIITAFVGAHLKNAQVQHPFVDGLMVPIVFDESVGVSEGTACVHTAPGCGPIDYEIGVKNNLEIYSPISPDGKYTNDIRPLELEGMSVADGQIWVIKKLAEKGALLHKASITHSYPHCWRCRNGLIFRATRQWFFDLNQESIKQKALDAITQKIDFIPEQGRNFLKATVEHRWEWCLSRQRTWGIPIPALLCERCDYVYTKQEFINKVADHIALEGIEYWDRVSLEHVVPKDLVCPQCKSADFKKETDILDVWFDSGVSHYAVLYKNPALQFPADIYLEGVDQHRGWFQSSLLNGMVLEGRAPMKTIMTHGFTVDAKGQKMSKSLGNVIAPQQVMDQLGTDGLRLWVASVDHEGDAIISDTLLKNVGEVYRKIRNTCRGLLMNLYDYDHEQHNVDLATLYPIDQYALYTLYSLQNEIITNYLEGDFTAVYHALTEYCSNELSAFYLDVVKDRLYCDQADGHARRSAQTTIYYILDTVTRLIAPIMSFTAEHLSDFYQKDKKVSIHLQQFASLREIHEQLLQTEVLTDFEKLPSVYVGHMTRLLRALDENKHALQMQTCWEQLKEVRSALLKVIELEREKGIVKHSLEVKLTFYIDTKAPAFNCVESFFEQLKATGHTAESFFKEFMIVSQVAIAFDATDLPSTELKGLYAKAEHADGTKCPRCWQWEKNNNPHGLDNRCLKIVQR